MAQTIGTENAAFQRGLSSADLTDVTATYRLRGLTLDGEVVASPYIQDGSASGGSDLTFVSQFTQLNVANGFDTEGELVDLEFDIGGIANANFDTTDVIALGMQLGYTGAIGAESSVTVCSARLDHLGRRRRPRSDIRQ